MTTAEQKDTRAEAGANDNERMWNTLRRVGWSLAALILLLPLVGSQFSDDVNWSVGDYLFAGIVLGGTGLLFELAIRRSTDNAYRFGVLVALGTGFLLTWINAAVGIVGSGANTANALYFSILAIALSGCWVAGFQAKGMSATMFATAAAQGLLTVLTVAFDWGHSEDRTAQILGFNAFFIGLWWAAGMLLRSSAQLSAPR